MIIIVLSTRILLYLRYDWYNEISNQVQKTFSKSSCHKKYKTFSDMEVLWMRKCLQDMHNVFYIQTFCEKLIKEESHAKWNAGYSYPSDKIIKLF